MRRPGNFGFVTSSPLFAAKTLKQPGELLTRGDLEEQYGHMTDEVARATVAQSQVMGRPLTRSEQKYIARGTRNLGQADTKKHSIAMMLIVGLTAYAIYKVYTADLETKSYQFPSW